MKRGSLWWLLVGAFAIAAAVGYRLGVLDRSAESTTAITPKTPIHDLVLTDLKAQPQSLAQWRGKILVVNYWATWCHPCREEMPGFSRLQEKYLANGVQFVGISIDDASKIIEFKKETPVSYPLLIGDMQIMRNSAELGNSRQALPFTAVFDREGRLAMSKLGRLAEPDLDAQLAKLVSR